MALMRFQAGTSSQQQPAQGADAVCTAQQLRRDDAATRAKFATAAHSLLTVRGMAPLLSAARCARSTPVAGCPPEFCARISSRAHALCFRSPSNARRSG